MTEEEDYLRPLPQNPKLVRLGAVDLFFFITAGGKGRRKGLEPGLSVPR